MAGWRLPQTELNFDAVHRAGGKHQVTNLFRIRRTEGEKETGYDDDLPKWNVENTQVTNGEIPHVRTPKECSVKAEPITSKFEEIRINMEDSRANIMERIFREIMKGEIRTIEELTVQ